MLVFGGQSAPAGMVGLVVLSIASYSLVLPVYRGVDPLIESPLAGYLRELAVQEGPTKWVALESRAQPIVVASPQFAISGMTYYPSAEIWNRLAPDQREVWNNFNEYSWIYDPTADPVTLEPAGRRGVATLRIDLCNPQVDFLDITYVITSSRVSAELPCFTKVQEVADLGTQLSVWKRSSSNS
jgi:hypothetical protein